MTRILLLVIVLISNGCFAQALWGGLTQGQYPVGFKLLRERDATRNNRPMLVSVWYPAVLSSKAKPVLFKDYLAGGVINPGFSEPTDAEKTAAYKDFHDVIARPFLYGTIIPDESFSRILDLPTAAKWNLSEARGKFPVVLISSEPESLSVSAEFLASNGFVVAVINAPYAGQQPEDSQLWVEPTEDLRWLQNFVLKLKNVDPSKMTVMGFGGGIQSAFFLPMKSDLIKGIVNLEGGVFGKRSLTNLSVEYHPEKIKAPMLHIVTTSQRNEDDADQQEALVNTTLYRSFIQNEKLRHHDFSIFGRVVNKGANLRGAMSDVADQAFVAAHKAILEFLKLAVTGKANSFQTDTRYMPLISLEKFNVFAGLVLHQPEMEKVIIEQGRRYKMVNDTSLVYDIYYPPGFDKKNLLPVVVFVNGIGSMDLHRWKIYRDWAKLVAANGLIGINYQTRGNKALEDTGDLLNYLADKSTDLGIDKEKIGLWSCSANVGTGLPLAMQGSRRDVKALVVYYGTAQLTSYRQDLEIQVVRAGLDFYTLNTGIDSFIKTALTKDLHFEYINHPEGQHAFDAFDDTPRSREIILQTVDFLKRVLSKDHPVPEKEVLTNIRLWNMITAENKVDEALGEWKEAMAMYRKMPSHTPWYNHVIDERNLNQVGYQLLQAGKTSEALKVFVANQEQFPESANAYDALGDAYEKSGDKAKALANAKLALEKLAKQINIWPQQRDAIKKSAEEKITRLQ